MGYGFIRFLFYFPPGNATYPKKTESWMQEQKISLTNCQSIRTFHLDLLEIRISTVTLAKWTTLYTKEKFFTVGPIPILINDLFSLTFWSWWKAASITTGADVPSNTFTHLTYITITDEQTLQSQAITHTELQSYSIHLFSKGVACN